MLQAIPLALATLSFATPGALADTPDDVTFDVFRNGSPFGEHRVEFSERPDGRMEVEIEIGLRVGFGPVTVFRYEHESEEVWDGGELVSLTASTLKDGDRTRYALSRDEAGRLISQDGWIEDLVPSSHWSGYMAGLPAVLNTETGEPMDVTIEDLGMEYLNPKEKCCSLSAEWSEEAGEDRFQLTCEKDHCHYREVSIQGVGPVKATQNVAQSLDHLHQ